MEATQSPPFAERSHRLKRTDQLELGCLAGNWVGGFSSPPLVSRCESTRSMLRSSSVDQF